MALVSFPLFAAPRAHADVTAAVEGLAEVGARLAAVERRGPAPGTVLDPASLRDLPSSRDVWSLLETADIFTIADRMDTGGLYAGEPAFAAARGASWTQTSFRLGDLDVTDPFRGGMPLFLPDLAALRSADAASTELPADIGPPGLHVAMVPRRPGAIWAGEAEASFAPAGLGTTNALPGAPSIARLDSWDRASLTAGGPVVGDRLGLLLAGSLTRARRFERDDAFTLEGRATSLLAHAALTPNARDELRALAAFQSEERPFEGRARFRDRHAEETARFLHFQTTWEHRADASTWAVTGGYQRGTFRPEVDGRAPDGTIERLRDGPVPEIALAGRRASERWDLSARLEPDLRRIAAGRLDARLGVALGHARVGTRPIGPPGPIAETVNGLPARVWDYGYPGPESVWRATHLAAYAAGRFVASSRLSADAALRFESTTASARGGPGGITWRAASPRFSGRFRLMERGDLALFATWGRYSHRLPLADLAFGDPAGPQGAVHRWDDANGDRVFQPAERGVLVSRVGPGGDVATIDPDLAPPRTEEVQVGVERWFARAFVVRFAAIHRRGKGLVESVNVGVPRSRYDVTVVPDAYVDVDGHADDRLLPVYDRDPASFGEDRYVLTNPADHGTLHEAFELTIATRPGRRLHFVAGALAYRSEGSTGYRGFQPWENDQGVVGELFDHPNADTYARGRLFFERNYVVKMSARYAAPGDVRFGAVARYQDGQPFTRLVMAPGLRQGPEAIQSFPEGRSRFTFTLTVDARLEKGFRIGRRRVAAFVEAFNLSNKANEVEEDVVTGPGFRTPTATQPPRSIRVGLRAEF